MKTGGACEAKLQPYSSTAYRHTATRPLSHSVARGAAGSHGLCVLLCSLSLSTANQCSTRTLTRAKKRRQPGCACEVLPVDGCSPGRSKSEADPASNDALAAPFSTRQHSHRPIVAQQPPPLHRSRCYSCIVSLSCLPACQPHTSFLPGAGLPVTSIPRLYHHQLPPPHACPLTTTTALLLSNV